MSDKRRPPSVRPGPLPTREPNPNPGDRQVIFHFDAAVPATSVTVSERSAAAVYEEVGYAWNNPDRQMWTFTDDGGRPLLLINLGKVRAVEIR
jgi:hypothetical protein